MKVIRKELPINQIINGNAFYEIKTWDNNSNAKIDLAIIHPPIFLNRNFMVRGLLNLIYINLKKYGTVIWITSDPVIKGHKYGDCFKIVQTFEQLGFKLWDTIIFHKINPIPQNKNRYCQEHDYIFVFCKGKLNNLTLLKEYDKNVNDISKRKLVTRGDIWSYAVGNNHSTLDKKAHEHPNILPEKLVNDLIISFSKERQLILDPSCGTGTVCKIAKKLNRKYIGIEKDEKWFNIAMERCDFKRQLEIF